jgi:ribosomal protein S18 acetylase RimI-like enzyme
MNYEIRNAEVSDGKGMLDLMPRLADFEVPDSRNPDHLWRDDAALLERWLKGEEECLVLVAVTSASRVLGFTLTRLRPEALSHEPSAHLEAIAVNQAAEGQGVAKALLKATEESARAKSAETLTLHVISSNTRAREFYERAGYFGELVRYIKPI